MPQICLVAELLPHLYGAIPRFGNVFGHVCLPVLKVLLPAMFMLFTYEVAVGIAMVCT